MALRLDSQLEHADPVSYTHLDVYKRQEYIQTRKPTATARITDRIGWQPDGAFVLPDRTIGEGDERIIFQSDGAVSNTFRQRGTVAEWRDAIARRCAGNSHLVFSLSCAFAGPLLHLAGVDSGGFHFRGDSSTGKTTALRVAATVWGGGDFMQRWRTTENALESMAAQHCDVTMILDELAQLEPAKAGECAYMPVSYTHLDVYKRQVLN